MIHTYDVDGKWLKDININLLLRRIYVLNLVSTWPTPPLMSHVSFPQWLQHWLSFLFNLNLPLGNFNILSNDSSLNLASLWLPQVQCPSPRLHLSTIQHGSTHYFIISGTVSTIPDPKPTPCRHKHVAAHLFNPSRSCNPSFTHSLPCFETVLFPEYSPLLPSPAMAFDDLI
jgi:hypothetical protein